MLARNNKMLISQNISFFDSYIVFSNFVTVLFFKKKKKEKIQIYLYNWSIVNNVIEI